MSKREADNVVDVTTLTPDPPATKKQKCLATTKTSEHDRETDESSTSENENLKSLEEAYRTALKAFKNDKTNKDLRRAKSAAKKAWDSAVLAATKAADGKYGVEPITCKDCSQMFVFSVADDDDYYQPRPTRCEKCNELFRNRLKDRSKRDSSGKNMCYDFQRGECTRGERCRFSHNIEHGGKGATKKPIKPICHEYRKTGKCGRGDACRFRHEKANNDNNN